MPLGPSGRGQEPLGVVVMALALALAAFTGAAVGMIWHSATEEAASSDDGEQAAEPDSVEDSDSS